MKRIIDREEAEKICKRLTDEASEFIAKSKHPGKHWRF